MTAAAIQVFNSIVHDVDGTIDVTGNPLPTTGYYVGGAAEALVFDSVTDANHSTALRDIALFVDGSESRYIGWWKDTETGRVYVDATDRVSTLRDALALGQIRGEIAVWDIANAKEIRVPVKKEEPFKATHRVIGAKGYANFDAKVVPGLDRVPAVDARGGLVVVADKAGEVHVVPASTLHKLPSSHAVQYVAEWATKANRNPSDVYIPENLR